MKKKIFFAFVVITIIIIFISNVGNKNDIVSESTKKEEKNYEEIGNNLRKNISPKVMEKRKIDGLDIVETSIVYKEGKCKVKFYIENNTERKTSSFETTVKLFNKKGENISEFYVYVPEINVGKKTTVEYEANDDLTDAYDYTIVKKIS